MKTLISLLVLALPSFAAAQSPDPTVRRILDSSQFKLAATFVDGDYERFVRELITLTEIPSPPFKEQQRASAYLEMLRQQGLADVEMDPEGNVMGVRKGTGGPMLAVVAHLDTVFPEGTDVKVKRDGTRADGAGHRRRHARARADARRDPRDGRREAAHVERHPVRRQRRRGR